MKKLLTLLLVLGVLAFAGSATADTDVDLDSDNRMDAAFGGTDQDTSGWTGIPYITGGVWDQSTVTATPTEINTPLDGALVTLTEFRELEAIGASTISAAQWAGLGAATTAGIAVLGGANAAAQATSIGVGTGDSPQFTAIELSHATANTVTASGGTLSIEGQALEVDLVNEAGLYAVLSDVTDFLQNTVEDTTPQLGGDLDLNSKTLLDTCVAFDNADATPDVSVGSWWKTANAGSQAISDFDDGDDHSEFTQDRLILVHVDDGNTTFDFTSSNLLWASQGANDYAASLNDIFLFKYDPTDGKWIVISGPMPSALAISTLNIPWGDADVVHASGGSIHLNETDEQIGIHSGDSGEISGEAAISVLEHFSVTFDPDAVCDGDIDRLFLMTVGDDAPEGITIVEWSLSFSQDPGTEFGAGETLFKRATAMIGVGSTATIDDLATSSGVSSEDTNSNINGDAVVANGQVLYIDFPTAYTATGEQCMFEFWYYAEED